MREAGAGLGSLAGAGTRVATGAEGGNMEFNLPGGPTLEVPRETSKPGTVGLRFHPAGASAPDVRKALRFLESCEQAARISVAIASRPMMNKIADRQSVVAPGTP